MDCLKSWGQGLGDPLDELSPLLEEASESDSYRTAMLPSSPILYETSSGSTQRVNSAGKILNKSPSVNPHCLPAFDNKGSIL